VLLNPKIGSNQFPFKVNYKNFPLTNLKLISAINFKRLWFPFYDETKEIPAHIYPLFVDIEP